VRPRSRRGWLALAVAAAIVLASLPFVVLATMPPDESAPARIAPYVDAARQDLLDHSDPIRNVPHHLRYAGARCSGNAVALLFEVRLYPFLFASGAYAVNGDWPPGEHGGFGGAFDVGDFDRSLRDDWVGDLPWTSCESA
jgi:hypothetical protein